MKKTVITAGVIMLAVLACGCESSKKQPTVCFKSDCFTVELAVEPEQRARGLMHRKSLDPDAGMLFIFEDDGIYPFWMKNTLIPLDMLWLDGNRQVVHIEKNVQPCKSDPCLSVTPLVSSHYVLEVNAGTADRIGIAVGDIANFNLP
ncbi:MAG: DUF192 domain-containing protein [Candidatus Altiarchaeota archaeon]|nr:DUF192 domain-containing protein [Candidatus Altiarchaeota archaeon]